jgi:hypothetical protein
MNKHSLIVDSILIATLCLLFILHFSSERSKCKIVSKTLKNADGEILKIENHICKEEYRF